MDSEIARTARAPMGVGRALLFGMLTVGTLDLLDAFVFFGLRGVAPVRILQSIASGWLGKAAFQGGPWVSVLGLCSHYFIAFGIVATGLMAGRRWPALTRRPALSGPAYGVIVYLVMNFVVIPLSAAATGRLTPPVVANGILIHIFGVGLPSVLFARAAAGGR